MLFEVKSSEISVYHFSSFEYPYHLHHAVELVICTEGTLAVTCNGHAATLRPGELMIAFPNDVHSYGQTESGRGVMLIFDPAVSEQLPMLLGRMEYSNFTADERLLPLAKAMFREKCRGAASCVLYGYLHVVIGLLLEKLPPCQKRTRISTFDAVVQYVSMHYTEPINQKQIAKAVGVSQPHLSRMFAERFEGGFRMYLQTLRVERAKDLLRNSDSSISEIAAASGFADQRTFNRSFKSMAGQSPRQYRTNREKP